MRPASMFLACALAVVPAAAQAQAPSWQQQAPGQQAPQAGTGQGGMGTMHPGGMMPGMGMGMSNQGMGHMMGQGGCPMMGQGACPMMGGQGMPMHSMMQGPGMGMPPGMTTSMQAMMQSMNSAQTPAARALANAAMRMHSAMAISYSGDANADYARSMIAHHQGAIEMAEAALPFLSDERLKADARKLINDQRQEVNEMQGWLQQRGQQAPGR
jgi:uncharacterized protein (DUF305 family)